MRPNTCKALNVCIAQPEITVQRAKSIFVFKPCFVKTYALITPTLNNLQIMKYGINRFVNK